MTRPRLRKQQLTEKPRVITNSVGHFWVERMSVQGPLVVLKHTFPEAITLANEWAVTKAETPC